MSIFDTIKNGVVTNGHGEVNFLKITGGKAKLDGFEEITPTNGAFIVGHSEQGHHHLLEAEGVTMRRGSEDGMEVLYAIVKNPTRIIQDAGSPHAAQIVEPGEYIITNNVEYDPFMEQARRVAD